LPAFFCGLAAFSLDEGLALIALSLDEGLALTALLHDEDQLGLV